MTAGRRGPGRWWAAFEAWLYRRTRPALVRWETLPGQVQFMKLAFTNPDYLNVFSDANRDAIQAGHITVVRA